MKESFVNLTVNPCNMCMPMGVVSALYGIKGCMTILHGSQGCSTYIRRHMATHYNEPIDISSSSLTEEGTVYGGEKNLIKGLENLIKLYNPEVIGIATTCLAETIGEDISAITKTFYDTHENSNVKLIPIPAPGYGGNQYDGYFKALRAVIENIKLDNSKNNKVNIVTGSISPADTRELKEILNDFDIEYILLPDVSENLDRGFCKNYSRLPTGGTSIEDIKHMAGAKATIEISTFIKDEYSIGKYLEDNFGVKNYRVNVPRGIRDTDIFMELLEKISGNEINEKYAKQRGRYIDGIIDSHKYNGEARVAIFGEPDFVYSTTRMVLENGAVPVVIATGNKCDMLKEFLQDEVLNVANKLCVDKVEFLDDTDFKTIEKYVVECGVNVMIGSSDGRRIEHKYNIPLIRAGFPIHDRVGGQRIMSIGYEGSMEFGDKIANTILEYKESSFRENLYDELFDKNNENKEPYCNNETTINNSKIEVKDIEEVKTPTIEEKTATHPCFSCSSAHKYGRMHLPIAPKCNISCNYCLRKYDCPNESRPGVTTEVLNPVEALKKYKYVKERMENLKVVGIAGPGDALANFDELKETLTLIKEYDKDVTFCLSTNGLMLPFYAQEIIDLGVSHVTITINAVDPEIGAQIYKYVDYLGVKYEGKEAAQILLNNQLSGLKYLADRGIVCKVNIVMLKGINEHRIEEVTIKVRDLGAKITNIMQMIPVKGSVFEDMPLVNNKEIMELRKKCGEHIDQMYHCKQCRADAIGLLGDDQSLKFRDTTEKKETLKFAVASKSGILVDRHFGHATEFYIYEYDGTSSKLIDKRNVDQYCNGSDQCVDENEKMKKILNCIGDCNGVLCLRVGDAPKKMLEDKGIDIFITYDRIESAVKEAGENLIVKRGQ